MEALLAIITLMTDFGIKDGNVGAMKGVILGYAPGVQLVDLSHIIQPQHVLEAALILSRSAPYFPPGTVHLVVVDPGVGTDRRPMAARLGEYFYVGPDNGFLTLSLEQAEKEGWEAELVHLDRPEFWRVEISHVFHGRDLFAPVAAHLVNGVSLARLGSPLVQPVRLDYPRPVPTSNGWQTEIIHVDHFGNLSTSLRREHLGPSRPAFVRVAGNEIQGLVDTFGERPPGTLVALFGSTDYLIVSEVNGDAARRLGAGVGDPVEVFLTPTTAHFEDSGKP